MERNYTHPHLPSCCNWLQERQCRGYIEIFECCIQRWLAEGGSYARQLISVYPMCSSSLINLCKSIHHRSTGRLFLSPQSLYRNRHKRARTSGLIFNVLGALIGLAPSNHLCVPDCPIPLSGCHCIGQSKFVRSLFWLLSHPSKKHRLLQTLLPWLLIQ